MTATTELAVVVGVLTAALTGWSFAGYPGAVVGLSLGLALGTSRWRHRHPWSWLALWLRRNRPIVLRDPVTVTNDRAGGGVRYQDGVAAVAVQLLGRAHMPTLFTGSTATETENTVDIVGLLPLLHQNLGLTIDSLSVVTAGTRRRSTGDYPQVYDTLIGTPPYAGRRETWIVARIQVLDNVDAMRWRTSVGTTALAVAQRISAVLRQRGVRARVATATDIVEMERRLGSPARYPKDRHWRSVRGDTGWLTTYGYSPDDITAHMLGQAWSMRADRVIQNVTLFPNGTARATLTVGNAHPPAVPPSVVLRPLPGEQALALATSLCGPLPDLRGVQRGALPRTLIVPVGPSGVLLGRVGGGDRLMLPLDDPGEFSRIHIAAEDALAKRIVIRLAGSGDRITVHTRDPQRWASIRMPDITVTDAARPIAGTTVSIVDSSITPTPRPNTVISVGDPAARHRGDFDVLISQTGPATVQVTAADRVHLVEVELFRAENRYASSEAIVPVARHASEFEPADTGR